MRRAMISMVLLAVAVGAGGPLAATFCVQTFTVLGKTAAEHSILFWDIQVGGECQSNTTYALFLGYDSAYVMTEPYSDREAAWHFLADVPTESFVTLKDSVGVYRISDSVYFAPPVADTTFLETFRKLNAYGAIHNGEKWCSLSPVNCIDEPVFHGTKARLIYRFATGLYKNYRFIQAVYFPESGYLVLSVDPPVGAHGCDTMRGLLVYQLNNNEESVK